MMTILPWLCSAVFTLSIRRRTTGNEIDTDDAQVIDGVGGGGVQILESMETSKKRLPKNSRRHDERLGEDGGFPEFLLSYT